MTKLLTTAPRLLRRGRKDLTARTAGTLAAAGAGIGALTTWFLDPQSGKRRRHVLVDRSFAIFRRGVRQANRQARYAAGHAQGAAHKVSPGMEHDSGAFNDPTLARKVESEIFRDADAPKDTVDVNAENGVVYLRGEVKHPEQVEALAEAARKVDGVREVKNLLHLPNTAAPMKSD